MFLHVPSSSNSLRTCNPKPGLGIMWFSSWNSAFKKEGKNSNSYLLTSGDFLSIDRIPYGKCFEITDIP